MPWNTGYIYDARVAPDAAGRALDRWLAERYPHSSLDEWRDRIRRGRVRVDRLEIADPVLLQVGQLVSWHRPPWLEPRVDATHSELFRDSRLLAVDKPAGLPTLPGGGFLLETLLNRVRQQDPRAVPLHRLGRHTSGVVLFALDREASARLSADWRRGRVERDYHGLASGVPDRDAFAIDTPIGPVPYPRLGRLHAAAPAGRPSRSTVVVEQRGESTFLARIRLETGRPHQVRIHLAVAGHPLVGDPLYIAGGLPDPNGAAVPGDPGYRLRATRLAISHPATGRPLEIEAGRPAWEVV